ncbi:MAG: hypothetical protein H7144_11710 [Burkholderiales bacterium]|nr:hypothetical protein [Phycisphaerae bacterium]
MSKQLKAAIETNDPEAAKAALKSVKDLSRKLPGAATPVLYACKRGADKVLAVLLDAGAPLKGTDNYAGFHPLVVAIEANQLEPARLMLERKLVSDEVLNHAVQSAAMGGHEQALRFLLETGKPAITAMMLRMATHSKNANILRIFGAAGADFNQSEQLASSGSAGITPLHFVVDELDPEMVKVMLEFGADINAHDALGRTPLMMLGHAMERLREDDEESGGLEMMKTLVKLGAKADLTDIHGNDVIDHYRFQMACRNEKPDAKVIKYLTQVGASGSEATVNLMLALRTNDMTAARQAIAAGADVNRVGPPDWETTPLMMASDAAAAQMLLDAGADPNRSVGQRVPLIEAADRGDLGRVKVLLSAGADLHALQSVPKGSEAIPKNALTAAEQRGHDAVVEYLISLGAAKPNLAWKPFEPGVHSWNDFSELLVCADPARTAQAIAKIIGGTAQVSVYRQSFKPGKRAYVVIRPKGMKWSNVFQIAPIRRRSDSTEVAEQFATDLAVGTKSDVLSIEYSDTSDSATVSRFSPDGAVARDDGMDQELLKELIEGAGKKAPAWAKKRLAESTEDGPISTRRLQQLAETEKFVVAAFGLYAEEGRLLEIDVPGYPQEAFDPVAWVTTA